MAGAYGIYDPERQGLTEAGLVLTALDDPLHTSNPMEWSISLGLWGLQRCLVTNGDVLLPLLKDWQDGIDLKAELTSIYQRLRPTTPSDEEIYRSVLNRLEGKHWNTEIARPVVEPLRDLGVLAREHKQYVLTARGRQLQQDLQAFEDVESLLEDGVVSCWARACEVDASTPTPRNLADLLPSFLKQLPQSLRGPTPTSSPLDMLLPWLQSSLLEARPPQVLESTHFQQWIRELAKRSRGQFTLRAGLRTEDSDLHWKVSALEDRAFWRSVDAPVLEEEASPPAPPSDHLEAPSAGEAAAAPPDKSPSPPPQPVSTSPSPPSPQLRAWYDWVLVLLRGESSPAHGGPETWLRGFREELTTITSERLRARRKESIFKRDFDNVYSGNARFERIAVAPLAELKRLLPEESKGQRLQDLHRHSNEEGRSAASDLGLIITAMEQLPGLRARAASIIIEFLQGGGRGSYAERGDRALRLTRWLVEDALFWYGWGPDQLRDELGSERSLEAARKFLQQLSRQDSKGWMISFSIDGVNDPLCKRIEELLPQFDVKAIRFESNQLTWDETIQAPSHRAVELEARRRMGHLIAQLDFVISDTMANIGGVPGEQVISGDIEVAVAERPRRDVLGELPWEQDPNEVGILPPERFQRLKPSILPQILNTLVTLKVSREGDRAAQRVSNLWVAIEHLVVDESAGKGSDVIRVISNAAALTWLSAEAGRVLRGALTALHRRTFEPNNRIKSLSLWEQWVSKEEAARYEQVADKIVSPRRKHFGENGDLIVSDQAAILRIAHAAHRKSDMLIRLTELVQEDDALTAWQLRILGDHFKDIKSFQRFFRYTRLEFAGLLYAAYQTRNRLMHANDPGAHDSELMLSSLYRRLRCGVERTIWALLHPRFDGVSLPIRWGVFEEMGAGLLSGKETELPLLLDQHLLEL